MNLSDDQLDIRTLTGAIGCKLHFFLTYYLIIHVAHLLPVLVIPELATDLIRLQSIPIHVYRRFLMSESSCFVSSKTVYVLVVTRFRTWSEPVLSN